MAAAVCCGIRLDGSRRLRCNGQPAVDAVAGRAATRQGAAALGAADATQHSAGATRGSADDCGERVRNWIYAGECSTKIFWGGLKQSKQFKHSRVVLCLRRTEHGVRGSKRVTRGALQGLRCTWCCRGRVAAWAYVASTNHVTLGPQRADMLSHKHCWAHVVIAAVPSFKFAAGLLYHTGLRVCLRDIRQNKPPADASIPCIRPCAQLRQQRSTHSAEACAVLAHIQHAVVAGQAAAGEPAAELAVAQHAVAISAGAGVAATRCDNGEAERCDAGC